MAGGITITGCKLPRQPDAGEPPEAGQATPLATLSLEIGPNYRPALEVHRTSGGRLFVPALGAVCSPALVVAIEKAVHRASTAPDANFRAESDTEATDRQETWAKHRGYETISRLRAGRMF